MGVSCEERNGVYLRCEAVNDRTKVRCVLKRLGIDFLKMFFFQAVAIRELRPPSAQLDMF